MEDDLVWAGCNRNFAIMNDVIFDILILNTELLSVSNSRAYSIYA